MDDQSFLHDVNADLSHYLFNSDDKAHMHNNYFIVLYHIYIVSYDIFYPPYIEGTTFLFTFFTPCGHKKPFCLLTRT